MHMRGAHTHLLDSPTVPNVGAGARFSFECDRNKGGVLVLSGGGAIQEVLRPNNIFPEYMRANHDSWCDFAREQGHAVDPEDIVMVRGTVKASEWTVAAFLDETRHQTLELKASAATLGSLGVSLSRSVTSSMSVEHRTSPSQATGNPSPPKNQCVFLNRYKISDRRLPWKNRKIKAEGYRDDEPSQDDVDGYAIEDDCTDSKVFLTPTSDR